MFKEEKKNLRVIWDLPLNSTCNSSPFSSKLGWIGCAIQWENLKELSQFFSLIDLTSAGVYLLTAYSKIFSSAFPQCIGLRQIAKVLDFFAETSKNFRNLEKML